MNDNHVINTHSHTHTRTHIKSFLRASSLLQTQRRERKPGLEGSEAAAVARMGTATGMDERAPPPLCKLPFMWRWARETMRGRWLGVKGARSGIWGWEGGLASAAFLAVPGRLVWIYCGLSSL